MPIYEYQCRDCGKVFEALQKITEEPLKECKHCKGSVDRLISNCSFQLKGTGWYVTDYKHGGSTSSGGNGKKSADKKEEKSTPATESTSATSSGGASEKG